METTTNNNKLTPRKYKLILIYLYFNFLIHEFNQKEFYFIWITLNFMKIMNKKKKKLKKTQQNYNIIFFIKLKLN